MDLEKAFSQNPKLGHLKETEYPQVFDIFEASPMKVGGLELVYERSPDFKALLDCQAEHHYTFVVRNEEQVRALASVSWSPRWVQLRETLPEKSDSDRKVFANGQVQKVNVSYAGDFRALFERATAVAWRRFYGDLLDAIFSSKEFGPSQYVLTAVLRENSVAMRNIVQHDRKQIKFTYDLLKEVEMVNFFVPKPWRKIQSPSGWTARGPRQDEENEWRDWLARQHQQLQFGYDFFEGPNSEWVRRKGVWSNWRFENFVSVFNDRGQRVLMTLPWAPTLAKRMRVTQGRMWARLLYRFFRILGFNSPLVGKPFETLYLTHFSFSSDSTLADRKMALQMLLDHLRTQGAFRRYNMVSFSDTSGLVKEGDFDSYFIQKTGVNLYLVRRPEDPSAKLAGTDLYFEMALV